MDLQAALDYIAHPSPNMRVGEFHDGYVVEAEDGDVFVNCVFFGFVPVAHPKARVAFVDCQFSDIEDCSSLKNRGGRMVCVNCLVS